MGCPRETILQYIYAKWLDDNDILIYLTHNKGRSVVAEWVIRTWKGKIYKKMTANNSKSYLDYLNKVLYEYNNSYHRSIEKILLMLIIQLWLKKLRQILKLQNLKLLIESEVLSEKYF